VLLVNSITLVTVQYDSYQYCMSSVALVVVVVYSIKYYSIIVEDIIVLRVLV
jgi:hypothetical protein